MIYNKSIIEEIEKKFANGELVKRDETPYFRGEIGVRKANLVYLYSDEEKLEIEKCYTDIFYFIEKYCKIRREDGSIGNIKLRDYQIDYINNINYNRHTLHVKSRQIGATIMNALKILHYSLFNIDKNTLIVANVSDTNVELLDKIKNIYLNLPFFLKAGIKSWNQKSIIFDNGCRIKSEARSKSPAIGYTIDYLYIDEFAHIPSNIINEFYNGIYPIIAANLNSKLVISSTPNGTNLFYRLYLNAKREEGDPQKNSFRLIETPYTVIPERDEQWVKDRINDLGSEYLFQQEYNLQFENKTIPNIIDEIKTNRIDNSKIMAKLESIEELLLKLLNK